MAVSLDVVREPPCYRCKNYILWPYCLAFPDGIPQDIRFGENDHSAPIAGDHGLQFELIPHKAVVERGGTGSGHHGHEGRPGKVGGSKKSGRTRINIGTGDLVKIKKDPLDVFLEGNEFTWEFRRIAEELDFDGISEGQAEQASETFEVELELAVEDAVLKFYEATGYMPEDILWTDDPEVILAEMYGQYGDDAVDENRKVVVDQLLTAHASYIGNPAFENIRSMIHLNVEQAPSSRDIGMDWLDRDDERLTPIGDEDYFEFAVAHELGHWLIHRSGLHGEMIENLEPSTGWLRGNFHYLPAQHQGEYRADLIASLVVGHLGKRNRHKEPDEAERADRDLLFDAIWQGYKDQEGAAVEKAQGPLPVLILIDDERPEAILVRDDELPEDGQRVFRKDEAVERGGKGSGHHGHKGRKGKVGGSEPSGRAPADEPSGADNFLFPTPGADML